MIEILGGFEELIRKTKKVSAYSTKITTFISGSLANTILKGINFLSPVNFSQTCNQLNIIQFTLMLFDDFFLTPRITFQVCRPTIQFRYQLLYVYV